MGAQTKAAKASPSPSPSPNKQSTTLKYLFTLDSPSNKCTTLINNPTLHHHLSRKPDLDPITAELITKISFCNFAFTFTDPFESPTQQDLKRQKLCEILDYLRATSKDKHPYPDSVLSAFFSMFSSNIFRSLPPPPPTAREAPDPDQEPELMPIEPMWTHLQLVYDILLKLVVSPQIEPKAVRHHMNEAFVLKLLNLFKAEDPRERESLKNVFHRIYSRFTFYRSFMRKSMSDVFLHTVFEGERHPGIGDLLEIWGSIINGFSLPLKDEHRLFLMRVLVPLHKPKGLPIYHRQLAYCVSQFVIKEPGLGGSLIKGILKYWPLTNCQKEVLLIGEIEELVEHTDPGELRKLGSSLCSQVAKCMNSWNSQVAERALCVWNNEAFVNVVSTTMECAWPTMVDALEKNLKWHWSKTVRQLTMSVKMMLEEMEPVLYMECLEGSGKRAAMANEEDMRRKEKWERLEIAAANSLQPCICVSQ
ncbi:serine/threonine protein phosphatase 2A 57 kDa regulatory subunit B' beta isoform [Amborella trichopoda]|uniref:Serine/threonine protein phosphatase 2A regulatory subunit n=1 Tax=Amborella trichopoda TaxID=13333 RepID=W1NLB4_AMBTC|nr:serine/threonine protein phosphatase 2A 57 kDa regulatory subunit B' beta isoform [Amborella trichopoda]ERM96261.1 hypothetical protein AMTR_s00001p00153930 [Amborella trichopoda]|eukprot:XP_006828845.1 serine/threonine protein phosphatase 2A 57 kDa regulatory subunit B' beta isoform [Amborella trichopoda]